MSFDRLWRYQTLPVSKVPEYLSKMGSTIASRVIQEILRVKCEVLRDDTQGHSCEQCRDITLNPIPEVLIIGPEKDAERSFLLDTTAAEIRDFAASGCNFWRMIWNKLKLIDVEERLKQERNNVTFDLKKHQSFWSDAHYKDLAATLGGDVENEFQHLCNSPVHWSSCLATNQIKFPVSKEEFVRVIIRYALSFGFMDRSVSVEIVLILPTKPVSTVLFPECGDLKLNMTKYWTTFWVLSSPGKKPFKCCIQRICPKMYSKHPCALDKEDCGVANQLRSRNLCLYEPLPTLVTKMRDLPQLSNQESA